MPTTPLPWVLPCPVPLPEPCQFIPAGHYIRLELTTQHYPRTLHTPHTTTTPDLMTPTDVDDHLGWAPLERSAGHRYPTAYCTAGVYCPFAPHATTTHYTDHQAPHQHTHPTYASPSDVLTRTLAQHPHPTPTAPHRTRTTAFCTTLVWYPLPTQAVSPTAYTLRITRTCLPPPCHTPATHTHTHTHILHTHTHSHTHTHTHTHIYPTSRTDTH